MSLYAFFERANVTISFFLSIEGNPISGMNIRNTAACSGAYDLFNQMMYSLANSN
ncbi:hypothetical protein Pf1_01095 [Flavobacterium columnare]|nr:hypothetical protein Pf1_01095 [Flavobacterium columnare]GEM57490.1 hypothetical protein FC1_07280 [Flavobacterium columnare NBRC 100251 = ATCC 23463]